MLTTYDTVIIIRDIFKFWIVKSDAHAINGGETDITSGKKVL